MKNAPGLGEKFSRMVYVCDNNSHTPESPVPYQIND